MTSFFVTDLATMPPYCGQLQSSSLVVDRATTRATTSLIRSSAVPRSSESKTLVDRSALVSEQKTVNGSRRRTPSAKSFCWPSSWARQQATVSSLTATRHTHKRKHTTYDHQSTTSSSRSLLRPHPTIAARCRAPSTFCTNSWRQLAAHNSANSISSPPAVALCGLPWLQGPIRSAKKDVRVLWAKLSLFFSSILGAKKQTLAGDDSAARRAASRCSTSSTVVGSAPWCRASTLTTVRAAS